MIKKKPVRRAQYVSMDASFSPGGFMQPLLLRWEDGRTFRIERMIDCLPVKNVKGVRVDDFTVQIGGQIRHIYFERADERSIGPVGYWYVMVPEDAPEPQKAFTAGFRTFT